MDRVRPFLVLLAALAAWLGAPAAAQAAAPVNTTPAAPAGWVPSYTVDVDGTDADGGPLTAQWRVNGIQMAGPAPANVDLRVKAGSRSRRVARTYKVGRLGTLPRIQAALRGASARTTVTLTVKRRVGRKWRAHASAKVVLAS